ncbi:STN domain-containing protein [Rubrivivax sp. A210]|uniref:secretin N-terminal domain-containing protein n=1 Tax=Rubrivivax sp. A210 TaxID=2772301 RepID=UPI001919720F|nr:secretin N-terminal domain-containing protein [Rubrivivax sp. A210]CAD5373515.1 STN domain-containing protein [Rubrivivax sp. A210]
MNSLFPFFNHRAWRTAVLALALSLVLAACATPPLDEAAQGTRQRVAELRLREAALAQRREQALQAEQAAAAAAAAATRERQRQPAEKRAAAPAAPELAAALSTRVNLEFREAPLRNVLEGLGRAHNLNFVFDRDVRADTRVNLLLRDTALAEGLRILFATQQLASKTLNERTLFIYPDTAPKRAEHRELVTRSFYLANADVKQAQSLVRTMAKTRDIHVDERLNHLVVRDTPEVVRLVERLIASIDVAEPEVVLELEVLEVSSTRLDEVGLQWPDQVSWGLPGAGSSVDLGLRDSFRASVANPAVLASLRETLTRANTLANPRLRARNREKAKVTVGEKLPVFTTTTNANGSSAAVTYLDVGLKLEVEPSVQLEGDVVMRVALEVSTLIGKVAGPQGAVGYQVGTREASTSLRLRDGETQILAGLIRDEDGKTIAGLPGASSLPLLGHLFGLHSDSRAKTEIVLLITPRVVRSLVPPEVAYGNAPGGSEASPGEPPLRLASGAAAGVALRNGPPRPAAAPALPAAAPRAAQLQLAASAGGKVGGIVSVTLANRSDATVEGELLFDATLLQPAQAAEAGAGRTAFKLEPGREQVLPLRVLAAAAGQTLQVSVGSVSATGAGGEAVAVEAVAAVAITIAVPP